jgi:hypothetical protein
MDREEFNLKAVNPSKSSPANRDKLSEVDNRRVVIKAIRLDPGELEVRLVKAFDCIFDEILKLQQKQDPRRKVVRRVRQKTLARVTSSEGSQKA